MLDSLFHGIDVTRYVPHAITKYQSKSNFISEHLIAMNQTHSSTVAYVGVNNRNVIAEALLIENGRLKGYGLDVQHAGDHINALPISDLQRANSIDCDAVITASSNLLLSVKAADCLPVFIMGGDLIAVIHAGRVGTIKKITEQVCKIFKLKNIQNISIWFGPSACVCCYEIDRETRSHFDMLYENIAQIRSVYDDQNIQFLTQRNQPYCTQCDCNYFYSYRNGDLIKRNIFYLKKSN